MVTEWASAESLEQLVDEHESLVATAWSDHWEAELQHAGLQPATFVAVRSSPEWDGLVGALAAEDRGLPVGATIPRGAALLPAGVDPAAALQALLSRLEPAAHGSLQQPGDLVAGLVPRARAIEDLDLAARAIHDREELITRRARELAEDAVRDGKSWAKPFGPPPKGLAVAAAWWDRLAVIAAYRDRWHVDGPGILGGDGGHWVAPAVRSQGTGKARWAGGGRLRGGSSYRDRRCHHRLPHRACELSGGWTCDP